MIQISKSLAVMVNLKPWAKEVEWKVAVVSFVPISYRPAYQPSPPYPTPSPKSSPSSSSTSS
jgi:hypothetical protein